MIEHIRARIDTTSCVVAACRDARSRIAPPRSMMSLRKLIGPIENADEMGVSSMSRSVDAER
jgi:hypothetical protein